MQTKNIYKNIIKSLITSEIKQDIKEEIINDYKKSLLSIFTGPTKTLTNAERTVLETKLEELLYSLHFIFNSVHILRNRFNPSELIEINKSDDLITTKIEKPYNHIKYIPRDED